MTHPTKDQRCVCGATFNPEQYSICPRCKRNAVPTLPEALPSNPLVSELREWADGLNPNHFQGTINFLRRAANEIARTSDRDELYSLAAQRLDELCKRGAVETSTKYLTLLGEYKQSHAVTAVDSLALARFVEWLDSGSAVETSASQLAGTTSTGLSCESPADRQVGAPSSLLKAKGPLDLVEVMVGGAKLTVAVEPKSTAIPACEPGCDCDFCHRPAVKANGEPAIVEATCGKHPDAPHVMVCVRCAAEDTVNLISKLTSPVKASAKCGKLVEGSPCQHDVGHEGECDWIPY